jgi:uncharacterized protein YkwD
VAIALTLCWAAPAVLSAAPAAAAGPVSVRAADIASHRSHARDARSRRGRHKHNACRNSVKRHRHTKRAICGSHHAKHGVRGTRTTGSTARSTISTAKNEVHASRHAAPAPAPGPATIASALATQCQNTEVTPAPDNLTEVDAATLCLVNQERARNGEQPLQPNARLQQAAQSHSEEMVADDYFGHVSPSGETPLQRVLATGYVPGPKDGYTIGENIAWGTMQLSTPAEIVAAWIASPEHLANILYAPYRDTAVAIVPEVPASLAEGQPGAVYAQEFGEIIAG